eukprot:RCo055657
MEGGSDTDTADLPLLPNLPAHAQASAQECSNASEPPPPPLPPLADSAVGDGEPTSRPIECCEGEDCTVTLSLPGPEKESAGEAQGNGEGEDDESDDEEDEEEEDTSGSEEDEVPELKYQRLLMDPLEDDTATCMTVSHKFLVLGTRRGRVLILDNVYGHQTFEFPLHRDIVNCVDMDLACEHVAACSKDGRVTITALYESDPESVTVHTFQKPICGVALDPDYGSKKDCRVVAGGQSGALQMMSRGLFGNTAREVISCESGTIHAVKWRGRFLVWASNTAIQIYDVSEKRSVGRINLPEDFVRPEQYRCTLCFENDYTLIIGWGNWVWVCELKDRPAFQLLVDPKLSRRFAEITHKFKLRGRHFVCGVAPFRGNLLVLMAKERQEPTYSVSAPILRTYSRIGRGLSTGDQLNIKQRKKHRITDYILEHNQHREENVFYIVCLYDMFLAKACDADDKCAHFLQNDKLAEAWQLARSGQLKKKEHSKMEVGNRYLNFLFESQQYSQASGLLREVIGVNAELWEQWFYRFYGKSQLQWISGLLPTDSPTCTLKSTVYELALHSLMKTDPRAFLNAVRTWPNTLYDVSSIIRVLESRIQSTPKPTHPTRAEQEPTDTFSVLSLALATLYEYAQQYGHAMSTYLSLKRPDVFSFIERHNAFDALRDKAVALVELDNKKAIAMLVQHTEELQVKNIVEWLRAEPRYQLLYLDALFKKDTRMGSEFHNLQVKLYAEYEPGSLYRFLQQSRYVNLEYAAEVCRAKNRIHELVHVKSRMGDAMEGLKIIMEELRDVKKAIEFIMENSDDADELIKYLEKECLKRESLLSDLLGQICEVEGALKKIDPFNIFERIPPGMEIPALPKKLLKIFSSNASWKRLQSGGMAALAYDVTIQESRAYAAARSGLVIDLEAPVCPGCGEGTAVRPAFERGCAVNAFYCGHRFHEPCYGRLNRKSPMLPEDGAGRRNSSADAAAPAAATPPLLRRLPATARCPVCELSQPPSGRPGTSERTRMHSPTRSSGHR